MAFLFRNLIYTEFKQSFKYEVVPQIKEKLEKAISDVINSNVQADQSEYHAKAVVVSFE